LLLPSAHAKGAAISQTSIGGAPLGLSGKAYETRFDHPWKETLLPESGHLKLTFPGRDVAVYFKGLTDTAVEITTWNKAYKTEKGVGPCSTIPQLKAAYGRQLKPSKFNTLNGVVYAWTVGRDLIFASNSQALVDAVALFYGDAPGADKTGGALSYASYIALNENACVESH
jgi:hypothetical protein